MFNKLKKSKQTQSTFKQRVQEFWKWYPEVAKRFYDTIEQGNCADLTDETVSFMNSVLPHMSWVYGPGETGGHSFTLSGEGQVPKQLLAEYWRKQSVELPGWTFYSARQPSKGENLRGMSIAVSDQDAVDTDSFHIQTEVDDDQELIHITAWHDALEQVPEEHHFQILFLLLDEALGEFGTQTWIGEIQIQPIESGTETRTLTELPTFIEQVDRYHKWEKLPPPKSYTLYRFEEQRDGPRGDTVVGTTVIPNVVCKYIHHMGKLPEDPLEGTGARLAYLAIDGDVFPEGKQSDVRGNIEDALDEALGEQLSGQTLGGAFGIDNSYIDLLLVDGDQSESIIQETLSKLQLTNKAKLDYFA